MPPPPQISIIHQLKALLLAWLNILIRSITLVGRMNDCEENP
jgi:hypothetical protein